MSADEAGTAWHNKARQYSNSAAGFLIFFPVRQITLSLAWQRHAGHSHRLPQAGSGVHQSHTFVLRCFELWVKWGQTVKRVGSRRQPASQFRLLGSTCNSGRARPHSSCPGQNFCDQGPNRARLWHVRTRAVSLMWISRYYVSTVWCLIWSRMSVNSTCDWLSLVANTLARFEKSMKDSSIKSDA